MEALGMDNGLLLYCNPILPISFLYYNPIYFLNRSVEYGRWREWRAKLLWGLGRSQAMSPLSGERDSFTIGLGA